jgi:large subunit ribosomal protein L28
MRQKKVENRASNFFIKIIIIMARCYFCGKTTQFGHNVSHAGNRTPRKFKANIKRVRAIIQVNGTKIKKRLNVCTTCVKMGKHIGM